MNVLVVAAHPDDEVLGMGGTILKHTKKNDTVSIVYLATGISSRQKYQGNVKQEKTDLKKIAKLRKNSTESAKTLLVKDVKFYDFPDNEMDSIPLLRVIKVIEKEIVRVKPEIIYTNFWNDLNVDHRVVFRAVLTACRPTMKEVKQISCFEVPSSTEWQYPSEFSPNCFQDISLHLEGKIQAFKKFKTEIRKYPHPRSSEGLRIIAKRWGLVSGLKAAEPFIIVRKIED